MQSKVQSLSLPAMLSIISLFCVAAAIAAPAQSFFFTSLVSFDGNNGAAPYAPLVQGSDGHFYGTTLVGGANGWGTIFRVTPLGTLTTLYSFCAQPNCTDGSIPYGALLRASDGNFYGTTRRGGTNNSSCYGQGCGTVFKITSEGVLTVLYSFCSQPNCMDGTQPDAALVQGSDGNLYGTTYAGGNNYCADGCGTVFKITPAGMLTTLYRFCASGYPCPDGEQPDAALVQAADGNFYGTSSAGGANQDCYYGCGTVFKVTPRGTLTTLHRFDCSDGAFPAAALVQAADGNLYGVTAIGGTSGNCPSGYGTVFKITSAGVLTTLYTFCPLSYPCPDGSGPDGGLLQARDGNFYGTTAAGGNNNCGGDGCGTVFKIALGGELTTLHVFNYTDGSFPVAGLVQGSDGNFYGTTYEGGDLNDCSHGCGTVFRVLPVRTCATCRP